jgi:hypothetical protein
VIAISLGFGLRQGFPIDSMPARNQVDVACAARAPAAVVTMTPVAARYSPIPALTRRHVDEAQTLLF